MFFRAFPVAQQPDPDTALREAAATLDATGRVFLIFVGVADDIRVAHGPRPADVASLVRALQAQDTLTRVVDGMLED